MLSCLSFVPAIRTDVMVVLLMRLMLMVLEAERTNRMMQGLTQIRTGVQNETGGEGDKEAGDCCR